MDQHNEPYSPRFGQALTASLLASMPQITLDTPVKQKSVTQSCTPVKDDRVDTHRHRIEAEDTFSFLSTKQTDNRQSQSAFNKPGSASTHIQSVTSKSIEDVLQIHERFLKKIRLSTGNPVPGDRQLIGTQALDTNDRPPHFEFNHSGSLKSKGPYWILNQVIRKMMMNEDVYYTNWAKIENLRMNNKMVVLVIGDANGIEIYKRIQDGRLKSLQNINNIDHSVVFDLFKQDDKCKFWSKIFNCPRVDKGAILSPNSFKANEYLLSAEDMRILDYPSKHSKNLVFFTETDSWSLVAKTDFNRLLAIQCEMVITKSGQELARISIVDEGFQVVYDTLVKPGDPIIDYVTEYVYV